MEDIEFKNGPVIDERTAGRLGAASSPGTSVVIVTYNSSPTIRECLESNLSTLHKEDEVIVVDNASADDTVKVVKGFQAHTARMRVIENKENLGYSMAANLGLVETKCAHLVLLNPDAIVSPRWTEKLRRIVFRPEVGACGPLSDNIAGKQCVLCHLPVGIQMSEVQDLVTESFHGQSEQTKLLMGVCLMFKRSTLDRIGLLDEDLVLGNDDLEISWRLRTNGLQLRIVKDVFIRHENQVSFSSISQEEKDRYIRQSAEALRVKVERYHGCLPGDGDLWGFSFRG